MASYYDFHGGDDDDVDLDFDESMPLCSRFQGIVFDKDGTLLDFAETWDPAIFAAIRKAAVGDLARQQAIADELGYDLRHRRCRPGAAAVHESNARLAARLDAHTYGQGRALVDAMADGACERAALAPRAGELLGYLREAGLPLAVATNDEERPTKRQLDRLGLTSAFATVVAADSGFGAKPGPSMLFRAAGALGAPPNRCAMVGDSASDLLAARNAGFAAAILVGPYAAAKDLAGQADYWIFDLMGLLSPAARARPEVVLAAGPPPEAPKGVEATAANLDAALDGDGGGGAPAPAPKKPNRLEIEGFDVPLTARTKARMDALEAWEREQRAEKSLSVPTLSTESRPGTASGAPRCPRGYDTLWAGNPRTVGVRRRLAAHVPRVHAHGAAAGDRVVARRAPAAAGRVVGHAPAAAGDRGAPTAGHRAGDVACPARRRSARAEVALFCLSSEAAAGVGRSNSFFRHAIVQCGGQNQSPVARTTQPPGSSVYQRWTCSGPTKGIVRSCGAAEPVSSRSRLSRAESAWRGAPVSTKGTRSSTARSRKSPS